MSTPATTSRLPVVDVALSQRTTGPAPARRLAPLATGTHDGERDAGADAGIAALAAAETRDDIAEDVRAAGRGADTPIDGFADRRRRATTRPGTVLKNTYVLGDRLGAGGMGEVFAAAHTRLQRRFAVKVLSRRHDSLEAFARFRREAEICSRLGHPNIVEIIDFDQTEDGVPFLVMELLDGEDLAGRLEDGPLTLPAALRIAAQIGDALAAAHAQGIVHRDLKPQNVFLSQRSDGDWAKILDFGISKIRGSASGFTESQVVIGTPSYMSPEQAEGRAKMVDARTDQFSLGVIVYEMLDGGCPFTAESIPSLLYQVVHHRPPALDERRPGLPAHVARAVERAMAKDPAERFADVAAFVAALHGDEGAETPRRVVRAPTERGRSQAEFGSVDTLGADEGEGVASPVSPSLSSLSSEPSRAAASDDDLVVPGQRRGLALAVGLLAIAGAMGTLAVRRGLERPIPSVSWRPPRAPVVPRVGIALASTPPADEILLDGAPVTGGTAWMPADGGGHQLIFRKAGFPEVTRDFRAVASGTIEVSFAPAAEGAAKAAKPAPRRRR